MSELKISLPYFNDPWMDNAVVNLYGILKAVKKRIAFKLKQLERDQMEAVILDTDEFEKQLWEEITNRRDNVVFVEKKDKETGGLRKVRKDFVLIGYDSDKDPRTPIHHRLRDFYSEKQGRQILHKVIEDLQIEESERNHTCVLCGQRFHKHKPKPLSNLKQAIYPFVTKIKSISGVRSKDNKEKGITEMPENYKDVCPACYLAGIMAWSDRSTVFRTVPGGFSLLLIPVRKNLCDLHELRDSYGDILSPSHRYASLRAEPLAKGKSAQEEKMEFTSGQWSLLFAFTENFLRYRMLKSGGMEEARKMACDTWLSLRIPSGQVKDVKANRLNIDERPLVVLLNLILKQETFPYKEFLGQLYVMVERGGRSAFDNDGVNKKREALSKAFLTNDFNAFAKEFVPRERKRIVLKKEARDVLEKLLQEWRLKKMKLEKEHLDTLRSAGNLIAETATTGIGLIYRLDRTRTLPEFWDSLREISRKMIGLDKPVKSTSLDGVIKLVQEHQKEQDWKEIKNLLLIYSCMYYSIKTYKPSEGGKGE